jgi:hypothetical protein
MTQSAKFRYQSIMSEPIFQELKFLLMSEYNNSFSLTNALHTTIGSVLDNDVALLE